MSNGSDPRPMLASWKAIAAFFDRDIRTVQRWEKDEGLPVHRHLHRRQSSVYAYPHELDAWWARRGPSLIESDASSGPAVEELIPEHAAIETTPSATTAVKSRGRFRPAPWGAMVALGAIVALAIWRLSTAGTSAEPVRDAGVRLLADLNHPAPLWPGPTGDFDADGSADLTLFSAEAGVAFIVPGDALPRAGALADVADVRIEVTDNTLLFVHAGGDFDGDGMRDLLLGTLAREPETLSRTGSAYILRGRRRWPKILRLPADADVSLVYGAPFDVRLSGCPTDETMDFNADGIADLVLGAADHSPFGRSSAGGIFVLFGRGTWPREIDLRTGADITIAGARSGDALTPYCATGDFNGDGRLDLSVPATDSTLWGLREFRGRYFVFLGRERWPPSLDAARDADVVVENERPRGVLAKPALGDVNGDGLDDLLMPTMHFMGVPEGPSEIAVLFGRAGPYPLTRARSGADVLVDGGTTVPKLAPILSLLDLDADGLDDILLGDAIDGRVAAVIGRRVWAPRPALADLGLVELARGPAGHGGFGVRFGDINADTHVDLVSTSPAPGAAGPAAAGRLWAIDLHRSVDLDVRPDHTPNVLYLPGILVARVSGASMSPTDPIDATTVRLAGVAPHDVAWRDADGDGRADLQLYFETARMRVGADTTRVTLTARTRSGVIVRGSDVVVVRPISPGAATAAGG